MEEKEKGQKILLSIILIGLIVGLSYWLINSLKDNTLAPEQNTKTEKKVDTKNQEEKKKEEKKEEKSPVDILTDKMMLPFIEYGRYIISNDFNDYYYKEDKYTFDTISDEEKIVLAITIYQSNHNYVNTDSIPSNEIRYIIKDYFGRELSTKLPNKVVMEYNGQIYTLQNDKYVFSDEQGVITELSNRIERKIVNKELKDDELVVSVNYLFVKYRDLTADYENLRSNIYTDFTLQHTLMIDVKAEEEYETINKLIDNNKTNTYEYHFKKIDEDNYVFDRIELVRR